MSNVDYGEVELQNSWLVGFGVWDTANFTTLEWTYFFIFTILIPLVFFNLLIAIVSDTFDRVWQNKGASDYKELASLILEVENLLLWNRKVKDKGFLHVVRYKSAEFLTEDSWDGKINALKKDVIKKIDEMDAKAKALKATLNK